MRHKIWRDLRLWASVKPLLSFAAFLSARNLLAFQHYLSAVFTFATQYSHWGHSEFVLQCHEDWFPNSKHRATIALELPCYSYQLLKDIMFPPWEDYAGSTVALLKCLQQLRSWQICISRLNKSRLGSEMIRYDPIWSDNSEFLYCSQRNVNASATLPRIKSTWWCVSSGKMYFDFRSHTLNFLLICLTTIIQYYLALLQWHW